MPSPVIEIGYRHLEASCEGVYWWKTTPVKETLTSMEARALFSFHDWNFLRLVDNDGSILEQFSRKELGC